MHLIIRHTTILLCFVACIALQAQTTLRGTVTDAETGEPIFGANIFIENSTVGSTADPDGNYLIKNIRGTLQNVVVSHAAYVNQIVPLKGRTRIDFKLKPSTKQLNDFELEESRDRKWRRFYKQFEEEFIGTSENAKLVTVTNPWAMELTRDKSDELTGYSFDLLEIDNMATGYHVKFLVESFSKSGNEIKYGGKPLFTPMESTDVEQQEQWKKNRERTYLGSKQHFLYALANNKVEEEGFQLYNAELSQKFGNFITLDPVRTEEVFKNGVLFFDQFLKVVYTKEKPEEAFTRAYRSTTTLDMSTMRGGGGNVSLRNRQDFNNQVSYLFVRSSRGAKVTKEGFLTNPKVLLEYGYWSWERVAELLPYEYHLDFAQIDTKVEPVAEVAKTETEKTSLNGFDISNSSLPQDEIIVGAPSRNAIPSIDQPQFVTASAIAWLQNDDDLIVVKHNGITKAYPIQIMNRHEVVNDSFDNVPLAITYCPLCATAVAFDPMIKGEPLTFGVSGLLYDNNVLLYDKGSNSLWSQITSKAISGTYKGQKLTILPTQRMKWSEWKKSFPDQPVLSRETGYSINYDKPVYVGYEESQRIPFKISKTSDALDNKELIVGISINGKNKAYPLNKLKKKPLKDELGGQQIEIRYSKENNSAVVSDAQGNIIPSLISYWFAWFAFHPNTEVY